MAANHNSCFHEMDEETANLILRLQIEEIEEIGPRMSKGKGRESDEDDVQFALDLQRQELEAVAISFVGKRICRSMAKAIQSDEHLLIESQTEEEAARVDREVARRLERGDTTIDTASVASTTKKMFVDNELVEKLSVFNFGMAQEDDSYGGSQSEAEVLGESSSWATSREKIARTPLRRCEACRESKPAFLTARAPCGHDYCRDCIIEHFRASFSDESLFPPRCCRQMIDTDTVRFFLKPELVKEYKAKAIEFGTPNRTYCSFPDCGTFIQPDTIEADTAVCPACTQSTCVTCKSPSHVGDCPNDTVLQQVLATARDQGWQRCYSCQRLVELNVGCNHMTCHCKAEFCYVCGARWKTCRCEQWEERRLYDRANQILDRDAPLPVVAPPVDDVPPENDLQHGELAAPTDELGRREQIARQTRLLEEHAARIAGEVRAAQVAAMAQNLRENHECEHARWRFINRPWEQCEECAGTLPQYIFECRQCRLRACNRCKRNRL